MSNTEEKPTNVKVEGSNFAAINNFAKGHKSSYRSGATSMVEALLDVEGAVRDVENEQELAYFIANETRKVVAYRQAAVFRQGIKGKLKISAISSLAMVDRTSPFVVWLQDVVEKIAKHGNHTELHQFSLDDEDIWVDSKLKGYPFAHALWIPFENAKEAVFAGVLLTNDVRWGGQQKVIGNRLKGSYEHAWTALRALRRFPEYKFSRRNMLLVTVLVFLLMCIPVSLTTLAPVEVVAKNPWIGAAPVAGVVKEIPVDPNAQVVAGDILYRFEDTDFRNRYLLAEQTVIVAASTLRRAKQLAFNRSEQAHEIAILEAELSRSELERDYAKEQLAFTEVKAKSNGLVLYTDRDEWVGKPVVVGEQVLSVADPASVKFRIEVPINDSIVLRQGSRVKVYLDADPTSSVDAELISTSYHATELPGDVMAYISFADFSEKNAEPLRIGLSGTAKIYGDKVPLFFYLFRKPYSSFRQYFGW